MSFQVESCNLKTIYGNFRFYCFNFGECENDNVLCLMAPYETDRPLIRIQSACFTAEIFRSTDCDCHEQLESALRRIHKEGGIFIYVLQDGRGAGIFTKVKGLRLGEEKGLDTAEAYKYLGVKDDPRNYDRVLQVLDYFKIRKVRILTNNPRKIKGMLKGNIDILHEPHEIEPTSDSLPYLKAKKEKLGHMFTKYIKD